jgi:phosphoserine phosphatase
MPIALEITAEQYNRLAALARNDEIVAAWMARWMQGDLQLGEVLIELVASLADSRAHFRTLASQYAARVATCHPMKVFK